MRRHQIISALILVLGVLLVPSCENMTEDIELTLYKRVTGVVLDQSSITLKEGSSQTLIATVSPSDATNQSLSWKSSDSQTASVDNNGMVKALKAGSATITVATLDGGMTATCEVTVMTATVDPSKATDLSSSATANCYIVSSAGDYKFKTVKGNTSSSVGSVSSASVVWETYGTSTAPNVGDLVNSVNYSNGYITFRATGKEGNALIAAKDAKGNILWSWHIWCTDKPKDQVYKNGAGTMMDRNLGATSATPGDIGALGLMYQWGRKDPFLGSSSISSSTQAKSTITWPSAVSSNSSNGTIAYATSHPTTFITRNENNNDWYYTGSSSTDNTRWNSSKGTYDPCPPGYRVPDGGTNGVWSKALGSSSEFENGPWSSTNKGMDFKSYFTSSTQCWYPASGYIDYNDGSLKDVGYSSYYWSKPNDLGFISDGRVRPYNLHRAYCLSVRCIKEGSMSSDINVTSVSLNKSSLTLTEGDTETLTATVSPSNATNKNVSWKSSNTSVATVSSSGKVSAIKAGTATITVTTEDGGKTATCSVTVVSFDISNDIEEVNCYEFNEKNDGTTQYMVTGIITNVNQDSEKYGAILYIKDATSEVYIYGTVDVTGAAQMLASFGAKVGDIITVIGPKSSYNSKPMMQNGKLADLKHVTSIKAAEVATLSDDDKNNPQHYIRLTGVVKKNPNYDIFPYGNFDLVDETGSIFVYGVSTGWNGEAKKFDTLGVKEGDTITIVAYKTSYNSNAEVVGMYISHKSSSR